VDPHWFNADPDPDPAFFPISKLQEKPSALKREHPAFQNMTILYFFLFLCVIFALLDPDPDPATQINADPCGSGYGSGSATLPVGEMRTLTDMTESL
jgi:hypothetical protein